MYVRYVSFKVSGAKWQYAARAAVMTMMGSFGGGCFGLLYTMIKNSGRADVMELINSILGSLVAVTAGCFLYRAWEALLIGAIGGAIACLTAPLLDKIRVDDPVGATSVHGCSGIWGVLAVGLFADNPIPLDTTNGRAGLFKGGGWYLLGVQSLTALCLATWGTLTSMLLLWFIDKILPIRMDPYEELLGADLTEHKIRHSQVGVSRAVSALRPYHPTPSIEDVTTIGVNTGHLHILNKIREHNRKKRQMKPKLLSFASKGFDTDSAPVSAMKHHGFLNHTGDPLNELHLTLEALGNEIHELPKIIEIEKFAEEIKGKNLRQLSAEELQRADQLAGDQDRFRHRVDANAYKDDIGRAVMAWLD